MGIFFHPLLFSQVKFLGLELLSHRARIFVIRLLLQNAYQIFLQESTSLHSQQQRESTPIFLGG